MKKTNLALFFSVAAVIVSFSFAYAETAQESSGGGGGDASSAEYQVKMAVADPGVSTSQSANYLYDHGTLWFDDVEAATLPPPSVGGSGGSGGSSGSGGGSSGAASAPADNSSGGGGSSGGSGGSGSGWITSIFSDDAQVGGVSPAADVPFTDTPAVTEAVKDIPRSAQSAIRIEDAPAVITRVLESPRPVPRIILAVDDTGTVREVTVVLVKNIMPWLLWLALALIVMSSFALFAFALKPEDRKVFLWIGLVLIVVGLGLSFVSFLTYRLTPPDMKTIVSSQTVLTDEVGAAMKKLAEDLPLGAHEIIVNDTEGITALAIKVFIQPVAPF